MKDDSKYIIENVMNGCTLTPVYFVCEPTVMVDYDRSYYTGGFNASLAHDGTSVQRLDKGDEGWLSTRERLEVSTDPLHDLPDVGNKVLPRAEAAKLILSDSYEG